MGEVLREIAMFTKKIGSKAPPYVRRLCARLKQEVRVVNLSKNPIA